MAKGKVLPQVLGWICTLSFFASGAAHGLMGWPEVVALLQPYSLPEDLLAGLAAGWYFGSACMICFGCITAHATRQVRRGVSSPALWPLGLLYLTFGTAAFVLRNMDPHFLLFILTGALTTLLAWTSRP
jgi:hypothetical protein